MVMLIACALASAMEQGPRRAEGRLEAGHRFSPVAIIIFAAHFSSMTSIDQFNFSGKRALIRVDFNAFRSTSQEVTDNTRIVAALPTIKKSCRWRFGGVDVAPADPRKGQARRQLAAPLGGSVE
ncbi:MAG: phosphoglycerate kinase [Flavobacteriales bacterium]